MQTRSKKYIDPHNETNKDSKEQSPQQNQAGNGEKPRGFLQNAGTSNIVYIMRMQLQRAIEIQKDLHLRFIDYTKTFYRVWVEELVEMLFNVLWEELFADRE